MGRDLEARPLQSFYVVGQGEDCRATLVGVEPAPCSGCQEEAGCYYPFKDFRKSADQDNYPTGGGGLAGGLPRLVAHDPVGTLQRGGVLSHARKRGKEL